MKNRNEKGQFVKGHKIKAPHPFGGEARNWRGGLPKCLDCQKQVARNGYCSKRCRSCEDKRRVGSGNYSWKGGITPQEKLKRRKFKKTIQKEVLKRDNYTCQLCGEKGVFLHVDHIQLWSEYVEGKFSIDNCRILCRGCHYKITFGKPMPKESKWGMGQTKKGEYCYG